MEILASARTRREIATDLAVDGSLAICAIGVGLGLPGAAVVPWMAAAIAAASGRRRPTALDKPFALLGFAAVLAALLSTRVLDPAMVGPLAAVALTGAVRDGTRAATLGALFVAAVAMRSLVAPHPGGAFLPCVALAWLAGVWLAGGISRRAVIPLATGAAILLVVLWRTGIAAPWWWLAAAVLTMGILGRRLRRSTPVLALAIGGGLVAGRPDALQVAASPGTAAAGGGAVEALVLLAVAWGIGAVFAALRRGWKTPPGEASRGSILGKSRAASRGSILGGPEAASRASILGTAGALGALVWAALSGGLPVDPIVGAALALLIALGLAAAGEAARPSADEGLDLPAVKIVGPRSRKAAGGAALSVAGAALGGVAALGSVSRGAGWSAFALVAALGALHLPLLPGLSVPARVERFVLSLRGLAVFCGAAFLAARPLASPLVPGSIEWWRSPAAVVTLFALGAAVAGAGHAIRRPGRIGPAPVAGALVCAMVLVFQGGLAYGLLPATVDVIPGPSHDVAMSACVISMLFVAFSGALGFGESELPGNARVLGRLPAAAVAVGLLALAFAGLR